MSDVERYVATIKELQAKLKIAVEALEAIEGVTNITEANFNFQPLQPIVKHNAEIVKDALQRIQGYTTGWKCGPGKG